MSEERKQTLPERTICQCDDDSGTCPCPTCGKNRPVRQQTPDDGPQAYIDAMKRIGATDEEMAGAEAAAKRTRERRQTCPDCRQPFKLAYPDRPDLCDYCNAMVSAKDTEQTFADGVCEYPNCGLNATRRIGTDFTAVCETHRDWGKPTIPITEYMRGHKIGMKKGREAERARIVAWLRELRGVKDNDGHFWGLDTDTMPVIADAIERGDHA